MTEVLIAVIALAVGGLIAWLVRGSFAKAPAAAMEARLASCEQQVSGRVAELGTLKTEHARTLESLRAESERRAGAEAIASRVPGLEATRHEQERAIAAQREKLAELETRITEERRASEEKLALLAQAEAALSNAFKALSADALKGNAPPAAHRIAYVRPVDALRPTAPPRARQVSLRKITAVRFALYGKPLPLLIDAVRVGEWFRAAAMGKSSELFGADQIPPILSGHGMPEGNRHAHAFWLPEDADGDGRIDHLVAYARSGFDDLSFKALGNLSRIYTRDRIELKLLFEGTLDPRSNARSSRLVGIAQSWHSVTPYLHPWHVKKKFGTGRADRSRMRGAWFASPGNRALR